MKLFWNVSILLKHAQINITDSINNLMLFQVMILCNFIFSNYIFILYSMFNLKAKRALVTEKDYKQIIEQINRWDLEEMIEQSKNAIAMAHQVIGNITDGDGCQRIHQEYLPPYIEALRKKYVELTKEKHKNKPISIVVNQLGKLFEQYQQRFGVELIWQTSIPSASDEDQDDDLDIMEYRLQKIALNLITCPNPKHLCCLQSVYEGKLNVQNLEHDFISVPMFENPHSSQTVCKSMSRQSLENAICAALNYRRNVVIVLGTNQYLEVVGIPPTQDLRTQYEDKLRRIMKQSIKPKLQFLGDLRMKLVPILKQKGLEQTENWLITIEVIKRTGSSCFIQVQRKGYHTMYLFYIARKQSKSLRKSAKQQQEKAYLKVEEPKGQQIYYAIRNNYLSSAKIKTNRDIHYFEKECKQPSRRFKCVQKKSSFAQFIEIKQYEKYNLQKILKDPQNYTDFTYIKFESQKDQFQYEYESALYNIDLELERQREAYSITKLKWSQNKKGKYEKTVFFVIIMHDYHPQMIKNTISSFNKGMNFEFGSVTLMHKLYDMKSNIQLDELKKTDRKFENQFKEQLGGFHLERFYTINSKNARKVYYKIKSECLQPRVASLVAFILNLRLGKTPQFVDERTVSGPKYNFPFKQG